MADAFTEARNTPAKRKMIALQCDHLQASHDVRHWQNESRTLAFIHSMRGGQSAAITWADAKLADARAKLAAIENEIEQLKKSV